MRYFEEYKFFLRVLKEINAYEPFRDNIMDYSSSADYLAKLLDCFSKHNITQNFFDTFTNSVNWGKVKTDDNNREKYLFFSMIDYLWVWFFYIKNDDKYHMPGYIEDMLKIVTSLDNKKYSQFLSNISKLKHLRYGLYKTILENT